MSIEPVEGQIVPVSDGSSKLIMFKCSCGNMKSIRWNHYKSGRSKTCGKCSIFKIRNELSTNKFGSLTMSPGQSVEKTNQKLIWICDCGRKKSILLNSVLRGLSKSCSGCKLINIKYGDKIGNFVYVGSEQSLYEHSNKIVDVSCSCGKNLKLSSSKTSTQKRCGSCFIVDSSWWIGRKFGNLELKTPESISFKSSSKRIWKCNCGSEKMIKINHVTSGRTLTCGDCRAHVYEWWKENQKELNKGVIPPGGVVALSTVKNSVTPFLARCPACLGTYKPRLSDIKRGLSLTCGCSTHKISSGNRQIASHVVSKGYEVEYEYEVGKRHFDVGVPKIKLLIEYDGTRFHSSPESLNRRKSKLETASMYGFTVIIISEFDWKKNNNKCIEVINESLDLLSKGIK